MATKYVSIEASNYNGKKCKPAQIMRCFSSKESAKNNTPTGARVMTEKQAEKFMKRWNTEFEQGNYNLGF